jgi:DNA-binding Lrp family transcriptional regulator
MSYKLDKTDMRIIYSLGEDARNSVTQIAKDADISRPTAIVRLRRLRKNKIINLGAKINITKLGYKMALATLKADNAEAVTGIENLVICPRVLLLTQAIGDNNYQALLYGENMETLVSVIESYKNSSNLEVVSWNRLKPLLVNEVFGVKVYLTKSEVAPCGKRCSDCPSYQNSECLGCPAVTEYKGSFE